MNPVRLFPLLLCGPLVALVGCAAGPTRSEPDKFLLLQEGRIAAASVPAFADCLLDGFDKAHFMLTRVTSRQQRRADSYRIETLAGGHLIVTSVDVFDDGRVSMYEAKAAALVVTSGEKEAFARCLAQHP